ncbi:rab-GTPase-TBC domain-containing protein [Suillus fuscotomentosus]|uniref:Rab-GTPase-TBC domain-containing protein n=1 Tax=Suillus fuscotomentosus TaxID=1912939 RepID=A0AAD4E7C3_9AGAM|nr:rab-GTPase-TBC domain-containing protein [Suillus fuscotomentosus]KAG1900631.1 rab-GTPase-TBC domain-containing protein [Suillus fuscotomentosus]
MSNGSTANDVSVIVASKPDPPSPLDTLLSPKGSTYEELSPRGSVAESDYNDVILDDDPSFSTVPLSGDTSLVTEADADDTLPKLNRRTTISSVPSKAFSSLRHFSHRKSASTITIPSAPGSNILARIGSQGTRDESSIEALRSAGEGQQKLHEEFLRLHNERRAEVTESEQGGIDWGFWGAVISDYQGFAASNPQKLAKAIEKGIPDALRGMMWQLMAASKDAELENTYLSLLKESSPHEKAITRDLGRTFPHHNFFTDGQGIGQEHLFNVLKAYSLYDPQVGYCQGLPFVVAVLLLNMPDEEAFSLLVRLMHSYGLRGHFLPEMPKLQLRLFDRLIEELLPVLHVHFLRQGIKSSMFCSQWFLTLFSYRFPLEIVVRIYDNCLASGIEAIFAFSIVLLQKNEDKLLNLRFDDILAFLKNKIFDRYEIDPLESSEDHITGSDKSVKYDVDAFVLDAISVKITPFMLDAYSHEYEDLVRTRDAHAIEIDKLRNTNRSLSAQVKELDTNMAQLNAEHVEILNQLVMARLRNEELEEELVRYKLLYAEAMHENQDSLSSHRLSSQTRRGSRPL